MAGICNILHNIPVYHVVCICMSGFVSSGGSVTLVLHYVNKSIHLPKFLIVIYFVLAIGGGISFLLSAFNLVKDWIKALAPEEEVAPPEQELPFPCAAVA